MTAEATPRQAPPNHGLTSEDIQKDLDLSDEEELKRYTPEYVIERQWLPYKSPRVLRQKVYRHEVTGHTDGGRVSFTREDIRKENERTQRPPLCQSCRRKPAA